MQGQAGRLRQPWIGDDARHEARWVLVRAGVGVGQAVKVLARRMVARHRGVAHGLLLGRLGILLSRALLDGGVLAKTRLLVVGEQVAVLVERVHRRAVVDLREALNSGVRDLALQVAREIGRDASARIIVHVLVLVNDAVDGVLRQVESQVDRAGVALHHAGEVLLDPIEVVDELVARGLALLRDGLRCQVVLNAVRRHARPGRTHVGCRVVRDLLQRRVDMPGLVAGVGGRGVVTTGSTGLGSSSHHRLYWFGSTSSDAPPLPPPRMALIISLPVSGIPGMMVVLPRALAKPCAGGAFGSGVAGTLFVGTVVVVVG